MKRIGCGVGVRDGGFIELLALILVPVLLGAAAGMVVVRRLALPLISLSIAEGGGGSGERIEARQRKHSPVPKYLGAG